ncbi:hypothetical protein [Luteolibacter marinus]|uniref:hypothetical protein n=1 Tax=Luteolibacter marinus TaxID=2776705 RepID=UPI001865C459|nr:hypothetical protein [Luteolibacter marinus]
MTQKESSSLIGSLSHQGLSLALRTLGIGGPSLYFSDHLPGSYQWAGGALTTLVIVATGKLPVWRAEENRNHQDSHDIQFVWKKRRSEKLAQTVGSSPPPPTVAGPDVIIGSPAPKAAVTRRGTRKPSSSPGSSGSSRKRAGKKAPPKGADPDPPPGQGRRRSKK